MLDAAGQTVEVEFAFAREDRVDAGHRAGQGGPHPVAIEAALERHDDTASARSNRPIRTSAG